MPTVISHDRINLHVRPEVSALDKANGVTSYFGGTSNLAINIPALTVRRADTTVELGSGQSFVIAGLLSDQTTLTGNGVPGLSDVPVLGALFRSDGFQRQETELVIVVTPYLVKPINRSQRVAPADRRLARAQRYRTHYLSAPDGRGRRHVAAAHSRRCRLHGGIGIVKMRISPVFSLVLLGVVGVLAGCGPEYDPLTREGMWQPAHVNRADLVMSTANPSDLTFGKGNTTSDGQLAAAAIERLRVGKVKKLQDSGISQISVQSSTSDSSSTHHQLVAIVMAVNTTSAPQGDANLKTGERATLLGFVTDTDSEAAIRDGMIDPGALRTNPPALDPSGDRHAAAHAEPRGIDRRYHR